MRRFLALIAAVALAGTTVAGYRFVQPPAVEPAGGASRPAVATVTALGRIEPRSEIVNLGGAPADVLKELSVSRGSTVTRGQAIGHFRSYDEAAARERTVDRQLAEARALQAAEQAVGEARIRAAEAQLHGVGTVGPARINVQVATIRSIEIDLDNAVDILNGRQSLYRSESGSRRLLADQEALVAHRRADLEAARARLLELTQQYAFDRANAEAALAVERATLRRTLSQIPVASLEQQLALARAQVIAATLVAPIDGTVLNILIRPGGAVGGGPILVLGDTSVMVAVAEVYETDVGGVRLGQRAAVTATALERPLAGTVVEIGRMIYKNDVLNVDPAARTDARVVQVRVALADGATVAGLTNLTVDVAIETQGETRGEPNGDPDAGRPLSAIR